MLPERAQRQALTITSKKPSGVAKSLSDGRNEACAAAGRSNAHYKGDHGPAGSQGSCVVGVMGFTVAGHATMKRHPKETIGQAQGLAEGENHEYGQIEIEED